MGERTGHVSVTSHFPDYIYPLVSDPGYLGTLGIVLL